MKKILALFLLSFMIIPSKSQMVDKNTAMIVAQKVLLSDKPGSKKLDFKRIIPLGVERDTLIYIFEYPDDGYVIVSADYSAPPVLGHCKKGKYNPDKMPPGLLYLIDKYIHSISDLRKINIKQSSKVKDQWIAYLTSGTSSTKSYVVGEPMLSTKWGQSDKNNQYNPGYNQYVPMGWPAGCTAVAMAQILYYWNCQINPQGVAVYEHGFVDIGSFDYYWRYMDTIAPNNYNSLLIFHAGVTCDTDYSGNGSTSTPGKARDGFVNHWGISSSADVKWRIWHLSNWQEMLENELYLGRPLLYSAGSINLEGHSWVIDGYKSNGAFYCNWGWYGWWDGPYFLGDFNPDGSGNLNQMESAIFNVYPVQPEDVGTPDIDNQSFNYNQNGYQLSVSDVYGATSYEWTCTNGTIIGIGATVTLNTDCDTKVYVRSYNNLCGVYSDYDSAEITIQYPISGTSTVCTSNSTFTCNYPSGATIYWSHSSNLVYVSGQGTSNYTVKAYSNEAKSVGWVKATITINGNTCDDPVLQKNVWVGRPGLPVTTPDGDPPMEVLYGRSYLVRLFSPPGAEPSSGIWSTIGSITLTQGNTGGRIVFEVTGWDFGQWRVNTSNSCGTSDTYTGSVYMPMWKFIMYPNPADDYVEIKAEKKEYDTKEIISDTYEVKILNILKSPVYQSIKSDQPLLRISTKSFINGIYFVHITAGEQVEVKQLIINH